MQKLGVLGGTFDPIHEGHIAVARAALSAGSVDKVILLPMAHPAHRTPEASPQDRLAMIKEAIRNERGILLSLAGMSPDVRYTVDAMEPLFREFPNAAFTFILGADKLPSLPLWHGARQLFSLCDFLCFSRDGFPPQEAVQAARDAGANAAFLPTVHVSCSSTEIRSQTARYQDAPGLCPPVLRYMAERGLYQQDLTPRLQKMMKPRRFQHTLGVRREAVRLAQHHGLPVQRAALAALLHDCAKGMPLKEMARIARENDLVKDPAMLSSDAMLHGPVGAYVARGEFGVQDEDVLRAISGHTIGRPGMTPFEMCIFVADATEEGREDYQGLAQLRALAEVSLPAAVLFSMKLTQTYVKKTNRPFFQTALDTMAYLEALMNPEEKRMVKKAEIEGGI